MSNHPQLAGGSHLPDITVITPVFYRAEIIFFVASRGHHAVSRHTWRFVVVISIKNSLLVD